MREGAKPAVVADLDLHGLPIDQRLRRLVIAEALQGKMRLRPPYSDPPEAPPEALPEVVKQLDPKIISELAGALHF